MSEQHMALARQPEQALSPFEPTTLDQAEALAERLAKSVILPSHLRNRPADVFATILMGRDLGLTPMQAMLGIYCVEGRPSLATDTAVALILRSGVAEYFACVESTGASATYATKRRGTPQERRLTWTLEQANKAGLLRAGSNWTKYPETMLRRRAAMSLARDVYPDVIGGMHDPDELRDLQDDADIATGKMIDVPVAPPEPSAAPARTYQQVPFPVGEQAPAGGAGAGGGQEAKTEDGGARPASAPSGPAAPSLEEQYLIRLDEAPDRRAAARVGGEIDAALKDGRLPQETRPRLLARYQVVLDRHDRVPIS